MNANRLADKATYLSKSWGRKGSKGFYKAFAARATRRAGKAACKAD
jgi:hypothetical protein